MQETRKSKLFSRNFGVGNRIQISRPDIQEKVNRVSKIPFFFFAYSSFFIWQQEWSFKHLSHTAFLFIKALQWFPVILGIWSKLPTLACKGLDGRFSACFSGFSGLISYHSFSCSSALPIPACFLSLEHWVQPQGLCTHFFLCLECCSPRFSES